MGRTTRAEASLPFICPVAVFQIEGSIPKARCPTLSRQSRHRVHLPPRCPLGPQPHRARFKTLPARLWAFLSRQSRHDVELLAPPYFLARAKSVSLTQSERDCSAARAAVSNSRMSASSIRQISRASRAEPFGKGGLPLLDFFFFIVRTETI